jgi:hypothetical protein
LITNHVHLAVTPLHEDSLPRALQSLGRRYVRHVNGAYRRSGTLWEGRYRAAPNGDHRNLSLIAVSHTKGAVHHSDLNSTWEEGVQTKAGGAHASISALRRGIFAARTPIDLPPMAHEVR